MFLSWFVVAVNIPQAKIADPKTPRPDDVSFENEAYTNPKYAGTVWYIADHVNAELSSSRLSCLYIPPFSPGMGLRGAPSEGKGETIRG